MKSKKITVVLLIIAIVASMLAIPAMAAETQALTETFVDSDGTAIARPAQSSADATEARSIDGYIYKSQSAATTHVYAEQHITYIIGYPDGGVKAERSMTRAEAVVVLYRLYNGVYPAFTKRMSDNTFTDVKSSDWFYKELETLYNVGILEGDRGMFRPNDPITRAEFAVICARYDNLAYVDKAKFEDVQIGHWAYSYINAAVEAGWIRGYPDGTFRPDNNITRAEVMALVNRLFNRAPSADALAKVRNPYNDITTDHWAFPDVMEATVAHDMVDWHGAEYNGGVYNIIIDKYVDANSKAIAETVTKNGRTNYHPAEIKGYTYLGYITTVTYVYTSGVPVPGIEKSASAPKAEVGDTVTYTVKLTNGSKATDAWKNAVLTDTLPEHMNLVHGSIYLNGDHAEYSYSKRVLTVPVGSIAAGKEAVVTFDAVVGSTAYGKTISNTATGNGSNGGPVTDTDEGVVIGQGDISPYLTKRASTGTAAVGQTIIYTLTIGNGNASRYPWENAVITDEIPGVLSFVDGSVYMDGASKAYTFKNGVLTIKMGNIAPGESHEITFKALVTTAAYGTTVYNTAIGTGDNTPDITAPDEGVVVSAGEVEPYASKSVDKLVASVGDTIKYTVTVGNSRFATSAWKNAVMTDKFSGYLSFSHGSVQVDGKSAPYSYSGGVLTVELGDIAPNTVKTITFEAIINSTAYNATVRNTAILKGENTLDPLEAVCENVSVGKGASEGTASKSASVSTAKTGDTITYTIEVRNSSLATYAWENAVITDEIPGFLTFVEGSVQIGGRVSTSYSYSGTTLKIFLGDVRPGEAVTATFRAKVNADAQGQFIVNTAFVGGDNHPTVPAPDKGVEIIAEKPIPTVTKRANVSRAAVGDTITYTIRAANDVKALADWKNVRITDTIPLGLDFVDGSVYINGSLATYTCTGRVLRVDIGDIVPGDSVSVTFKAVVNEDGRGKTIENTAFISGDNGGPLPAPDDGIKIDMGEPVPTVRKSASVAEANVGDTVTYEITVSNSITATADWRGVTVSDVIPAGFDFKYGSVFVNGASASYTYSGRALTVRLGDLVPGETAIVKFSVTVTGDAQGKTVYNTVSVSGSNSTPETSTDDGVTVPDENYGGDASKVYGSKTADVLTVTTGDYITYTITAGNSSVNDFTWYDVSLYDIIDTALSKIDVSTITIDGVKAVPGQYSYSGGQLIVHIGTVAPAQEVVITFKVKVTSEANGELISNTATLKGSNADGGPFNTSVRINLENKVIVPPEDGLSSDIHLFLFDGYKVDPLWSYGTATVNGFEVYYCDTLFLDGSTERYYDGCWMPDNTLQRDELAQIFYRLMCKPKITSFQTIADVDTGHWAYEAVNYAIQEGIFTLDQFDNFNPDERATQAELGLVLAAFTGDDCGFTSAEHLTRIRAARALVEYTSRSENHDSNGVTLPIFYDIPTNYNYYDVIMEVSADHDYYYNGNKEVWDKK